MDSMANAIRDENKGILRLRDLVRALRPVPSNSKPGKPDLKSICPIVFVPGFSGWGRPLFGSFNYFGGFENLPLILSNLGYIVIVVRIGPISTNHERACEIFAQLRRINAHGPGGFDRPHAGRQPSTLIPVDFGPRPASFPGNIPSSANDETLAAVVYDHDHNRLPDSWQWSDDNKVNFICHSQGGTTVRHLIQLLAGTTPGQNQFNPSSRQSWIKSVVTLGTPHKGTTVTDVLEVGNPLFVLIAPKISNILQETITPPRGLDPLVDFITSCSFESRQHRIYDLHLDHWGFARLPAETYQAMRARIARTIVNDWWTNRCNGLYDNSIRGVQDLDTFAPQPSPDIYYFTMSFCATVPFPERTLTAEDVNEFFDLLPLHEAFNAFGISGLIATNMLQLFHPPTRATLAWITRVARRHLQSEGYFSQIPLPGSQVPRPDVLPLIQFSAYAMGGGMDVPAGAPPTITSDGFAPNDGVVNTASMEGPVAGPIDNGDFAAALAAHRRGRYWHLGSNSTIDHADQIGVFTDPVTFDEVRVMYILLAELVSLL
ncbi:hypothetical protein PG984_005418 [Apiospora sp. TS-2023a]